MTTSATWLTSALLAPICSLTGGWYYKEPVALSQGSCFFLQAQSSTEAGARLSWEVYSYFLPLEQLQDPFLVDFLAPFLGAFFLPVALAVESGKGMIT